jgi:hypothetical protein
VMTGKRALMGIPNGRDFSPNAKSFSIAQCSWLPNKDFVHIRLEQKFPNAFKIVKVRMHRSREIITRQMQKIKFHIYCRNSNIPSTN